MYRILVVGCGHMAETWVRYALERPDTDIVGLVDIVRANADALAARHHLTADTFSDVGEAIRRTQPDIVFDISTPESHKSVVSTALEAGCTVFGEKPMATTMADALALVELAERTGRTYAVMQNRRYNPQIRALADLVRGGTVGRPGWTTAHFFLGPHFGGFRDQMPHPLLLDMAIHTFDQARMILGADPVAVTTNEFNPPGSWYAGNAAAVSVFEFADGSRFSYEGSWCAEGAPTSWEAEWRVMGDHGTALWDGTHPPYAEVVVGRKDSDLMSETRRVEPPLSWDGRTGHFGCLDAMFSALEANRRPETDCRDNIKSLAMVLAAVESAETGRRVPIAVA